MADAVSALTALPGTDELAQTLVNSGFHSVEDLNKSKPAISRVSPVWKTTTGLAAATDEATDVAGTDEPPAIAEAEDAPTEVEAEAEREPAEEAQGGAGS